MATSVSIPRLALAMDAAANKPSDYVARFLFPTSDVLDAEVMSGSNRMKAKVMKIDRANVLGPRGRSLKRPMLQRATQRTVSMSETTIEIDERAEEIPFSDKEFETYRKRLRNVEDRIVAPALAADFRIDEENDFVAMFTGGSFTQGTANAVAANRWDSDSSNPITDFDAGFDSIKVGSGLNADGLALTKDYADALKHNHHMRSLLRLDERGSLTRAQLEELIRDSLYQLSPQVMGQASSNFEVRIAMGVHDSAAEGLTSTPAYIWQTGALLTARPPIDARGMTTVETIGGGKTFQAEAYSVKRYEDDTVDGVFYKGRSWDKASIVDVKAFFFFTGFSAAG